MSQNIWWVLLIAIGFLLRFRQYFAIRSLWVDEASLALNLVGKSFGELFQPLDYHQAAPIGFLLVVKAIISILGNRDYILHLFPFLMGLSSIYLIYRIARDYFGKAGLFTVLFFAGNVWLIYYASELKQYGTDVTAALLLVYLGLRCWNRGESRDYLWLGIAGTFAIWLSHPSIFILAAIGITLVLETILIRKEYASLKRLVLMGLVWLISFGIHYVIVLQHTAVDDYFQTFWRRAFLPLPPWGNLQWYLKTYYSFLLIFFSRTDPVLFYMFPALSVLGIVSLFLRRRGLAWVTLFVFLFTFAASALQRYPLVYRFMLFLIPFALFLVTEAVLRIYSLVARWNKIPAVLLSAVPVIIMLGYSMPAAYGALLSPQSNSELRPVVKYVADHRQANDVIYVYYGSVTTFQYYAPIYKLESPYIILAPDAPTKKKGLQNFFSDVEGLAGKERVWFIFSDIVDCDGCEGDPRLYFVNELNQYGTLLDKVESTGAAGYLYDLNSQP